MLDLHFVTDKHIKIVLTSTNLMTRKQKHKQQCENTSEAVKMMVSCCWQGKTKSEKG